MTTLLRTLAVGVTLAALLPGCTDQPAPLDPGGAPSLKRAKGPKHPEHVLVLQRLQPLPHDITKSKWIDRGGGTIEIKEAGLKIDFKDGALSEPTLITVTALAGSDVAYEFGPHGTVFGGEVRIEQRLDKTTARDGGVPLEAGYFKQEEYHARAGGAVLVHEVIPVALDGSRKEAEFTVEHFSGYLLASGRQ